METGHSRGLSGSRFAPQNSGYGSGYTRAGGRGGGSESDWECASCRFSNFGWRKECFRCDKAKGWSPNDASAGLQSNNENWKPILRSNGKASSVLGISNGPQEVHNINGQPPARSSLVVNEETGNEPRGALAMSIWAPRNRTASQKYGDKPWTRVSSPSSWPVHLLTNLPRFLQIPHQLPNLLQADHPHLQISVSPMKSSISYSV